MKALALLAVPAAALALAACGSTSPTPAASHSTPTATTASGPSTSATAAAGPSTGPAASAPSGGAVKVTIKNLAFSPATVQVKSGDTIVFTNDDSPPHNVTWVSGPKFTSSSTLNPGSSFTLKVTQAGTIHYYCSIHPFMKGTIVVSKKTA
jgi:plastocyanin